MNTPNPSPGRGIFLPAVVVAVLLSVFAFDAVAQSRNGIFGRLRAKREARKAKLENASKTKPAPALPQHYEVRKAIPIDQEYRPSRRAVESPSTPPAKVSKSSSSNNKPTGPNSQARFLAGLSGSGYSGLRHSSLWQSYARNMDGRWARAENRLSAIRAWRGAALGRIGATRNTVFYPFSGPDFLYAHAFFPSANTYLLCGLEPVGNVTDLSALSDGQLRVALSGLETSMATSLDFSYFITKDMRRDLNATPLKGALPIMLVHMARTGHHVSSVQRVSLTSSGKIVNSGNGNGVKVRCSGPGGSKTVYYFSQNLANGSSTRFEKLMAANRPGVTFLKSASYLLHGGSFSSIRNAILTHSQAVVQDPSGVPYRNYKGGNWNISLYGNYVGTLDMFKNYFQSDLYNAFASQGGRPLGFGVGYEWQPRKSSVLVATKR